MSWEYLGCAYVAGTSFQGGVADATPNFRRLDSLDAIEFSLKLRPLQISLGEFRNQQFDTSFTTYSGVYSRNLSDPICTWATADQLAFSRLVRRVPGN